MVNPDWRTPWRVSDREIKPIKPGTSLPIGTVVYLAHPGYRRISDIEMAIVIDLTPQRIYLSNGAVFLKRNLCRWGGSDGRSLFPATAEVIQFFKEEEGLECEPPPQ